MKRFFAIAVLVVMGLAFNAEAKPGKSGDINLSGTWAFGMSDGKVSSTGIIIYQKGNQLFADLKVIASPPAVGFFIDKNMVFLDFNKLGKFYGRVINDSYIEWTNNSFWARVSPLPEKEAAKAYDLNMDEAKKSGSLREKPISAAEAKKDYSPALFDNVKINRTADVALSGDDKTKTIYDKAYDAATVKQNQKGGNLAKGKYIYICEWEVNAGGKKSYEIGYQIVDVDSEMTQADIESSRIDENLNRVRPGRLEMRREMIKCPGGDCKKELKSSEERYKIRGESYSTRGY